MNKPLDKIKLLLTCIPVSIAVALTYFIFESAVRHSITFVCDTTFNTADNRWLVLPLSLVGALLFFGVQHLLDAKSEKQEEHGLGGSPINPTLKNFSIILIIGFFSLVGGASLGPEAVLVPACTVIGAYIGTILFKNNKLAVKALSAAAIMALFTSFFHSYLVGILSVLLVAKLGKTKVNAQLLVIAVISSVTAFLTLNIIDPQNSYFNLPAFTWKIIVADVLVGAVLILAGYASTFALKYVHTFFVSMRTKFKLTNWLIVAVAAGLVLGLLYLLGGPLVEFTGNESINPLIAQASSLGVWGVIVIFVVKIMAIGWSKAMGYRGGLIFPMVFVASSLAVLSQLFVSDVNLGIGLIAAMVGILAAEAKVHILI